MGLTPNVRPSLACVVAKASLGPQLQAEAPSLLASARTQMMGTPAYAAAGLINKDMQGGHPCSN